MMPALAISKKLVQRSDRVKSVDMHPTEPWVLVSLYTGKAIIYNYSTQVVVKTFDVSDLPVRCARFVARKQWIVTGADDMQIRVYNYNTQERLVSFEAHSDYIRCLEVHPTQPYLITTSDDMTAKLWDWDKGWACMATYEGHAHYVMAAKFNPKDTNTFATASLDRSVKVWSLGTLAPNFSLEGHERGVNCVDYYPGGDKPYIVSGADDATLRIWDYQTRSCVTVLEGHTHNVCAVSFHPRLPLVLSGSEDGSVRVWHNTTYRLETTLHYGFERAWAIGVCPTNNKVALGFDDGTIVIKMGREVPVVSMDRAGKLIIARNNVIFSSAVRASGGAGEEGEEGGAAGGGAAPALVDGERVPLPERELGSVEHFPQHVLHNANGRFVAVVGDNEYVIYTAQALRNKSYGAALDFTWSSTGVGDYAVRESATSVRIFRNFKEAAAIRPPVSADGLTGGALLGVRSPDTVCFYDWETGRLVRRIEVAARSAAWNDSGELVAIAGEDAFYVLRYSREAAAAAVAAGGVDEAEGAEAAFEVQHEVSDKVLSGTWVGDCYLYVNASNRLVYYVGGEVMTLAHLDRRCYILGYLAREGRVFLMDKAGVVTSYALSLAVLEYQTAVVRRDFGAANRILPSVPSDQSNAIARFLEGQGFKEHALAVATDPDLKFDLALQLGRMDDARTLLRDAADAAGADAADSADLNAKWKQLLDLALARSDLDLAEEAAVASRDLGALLLLYTSTGDAEGLRRLGGLAEAAGRGNVAFLAYYSAGAEAECARVLAASGQTVKAEIFAQVYAKPTPAPAPAPVSPVASPAASLAAAGGSVAAAAVPEPPSARSVRSAPEEDGARAAPASPSAPTSPAAAIAAASPRVSVASPAAGGAAADGAGSARSAAPAAAASGSGSESGAALSAEDELEAEMAALELGTVPVAAGSKAALSAAGSGVEDERDL